MSICTDHPSFQQRMNVPGNGYLLPIVLQTIYKVCQQQHSTVCTTCPPGTHIQHYHTFLSLCSQCIMLKIATSNYCNIVVGNTIMHDVARTHTMHEEQTFRMIQYYISISNPVCTQLPVQDFMMIGPRKCNLSIIRLDHFITKNTMCVWRVM